MSNRLMTPKEVHEFCAEIVAKVCAECDDMGEGPELTGEEIDEILDSLPPEIGLDLILNGVTLRQWQEKQEVSND